MNVPPVIRVDRLTKRYGAARGVENLGFSVQPGEIFGFLGPNGSGIPRQGDAAEMRLKSCTRPLDSDQYPQRIPVTDCF